MKNLLLFLLSPCFLPAFAEAQIDWDNYSTSFQGNGKEGAHPVLVTAIPYNGIYGGATYFPDKSEKLHLADSLYTPEEKRPAHIGESTTMDSGEVYFLAPGIHPANANRYEFRVVLDGKQTFLPWSPITRFVDSGRELNEFLPNYGFLGGYKTTWGHSLLVEIREKATKTIESGAIVYWKKARATLSGIYSAQNLRDFVASKRLFRDWKPDSAMNRRLAELDSGKLQFEPGDNTLILYVDAEVYQKGAFEYQVTHDGGEYLVWRPNSFENNFIFLNKLPPGEYTLQLRLRAQRDNVTTYSFHIKPAWYETKLYRFFLGALQAFSGLGIVLLYNFFVQRRKTRREKAAREKLTLELGYIRSQLNPHFIFNSLSSIQGLVNRNEIDAANRYLSEFGRLLRDSLAISDQYFTDLQREMRILDTYLQLEQLRFGFRYTIDTGAGLPVATTEIPAFLLQPIVENAVKHGVAGMQENGFIRILFSRENGNFIAQVSDNGKGMEGKAPGAGYGLKLTRERIRLLNRLMKDRDIGMTIDSTASGATITLRFTNWWN